MISTVLDAIGLRDAAAALGWHPNPAFLPRRLYALENPAYPRRQIVVPMDDTFDDTQDALSTALSKLAEIHHLSPAKIAMRAATAGDDILAWRLPINQPSIPLNFAGTVIESTRKALLSAAASVEKPRVHHPKLNLALANEIVSKCRFGHTEPGSFVMNVFCPVMSVVTPPKLPFAESSEYPVVRRTTLALYDNLTRLLNAIEEDQLTQLTDTLLAEQEPMLSSNFCEAILGLYDESYHNAVEVGFDWSAKVAVPARVRTRATLRIQPSYFARIQELGTQLRRTEQAQTGTFIATVEKMLGVENDRGEREGEVICNVFLTDGDVASAKLVLDAAQYGIANKAHMTTGPDRYVRLAGSLQPGRNPRWLTDITHFASDSTSA